MIIYEPIIKHTLYSRQWVFEKVKFCPENLYFKIILNQYKLFTHSKNLNIYNRYKHFLILHVITLQLYSYIKFIYIT